VACACRKPGTGMIEEAARRYHLDLKSSWMVGDSARDMECARRAGMRSVLVARGGGGGPEADFHVADLAAAVERILEESGLSPAGARASLTAR